MIFVGNWKAYIESPQKAKALFASAKRLAGRKGVRIILAPSAPHVGLLAPGNRSKVSFALQDISNSTGGAETGEVTAAAAFGIGARYVILGHSERRARGESDQIIFSKVQHTLAHGMTPVLCIGERERDSDAQYLQFIRAQLAAVFSGLTPQERIKIIVAYEPIWAIGLHASDAIAPGDLAEMILYIRKVLGDYMSSNQILYGGSVEPGNVRMLAAGSGVDGFLIGHASVDVQNFTALVKAVS
ncbi:MAG: triose-phosphate isomerase [Parcubacteria bacterium C7867-007]|nr:MAG: triose-phosphate isomerase [Parcubacteria bacterium C7867-007]